jgi:hypothetical protein
MRLLKLDLFIVVVATVLIIGACVPRLSNRNISMIAVRGQTGLLGQSFRIEFRRDGKAAIECSFYKLNSENKPASDMKMLCDDLYRQYPASFHIDRNNLVGKFSGTIASGEFAGLSKTLNDNAFFSMKDGWEFDGRLDAPPSFVEVEFDGQKKEVGDSGAKENKPFSEIKSSIYALGKDTAWASN